MVHHWPTTFMLGTGMNSAHFILRSTDHMAPVTGKQKLSVDAQAKQGRGREGQGQGESWARPPKPVLSTLPHNLRLHVSLLPE